MDEPNLIAVSRKITSFARSNNETTVFSVPHGHFIQRDSKNSKPAFAIKESFNESAHM